MIADTNLLTGKWTVISRGSGRENQEQIFRELVEVETNEAVSSGMLFSAIICLRNESHISSTGVIAGKLWKQVENLNVKVWRRNLEKKFYNRSSERETGRNYG